MAIMLLSGTRRQHIGLHGVKYFHDVVDFRFGEHRLRPRGSKIRARRFVETSRFHDFVGSEFIDDEVDEMDGRR